MLKTYIRKIKGSTKSPPAVNFSEILWSWTGAFAGIAIIGCINDFILSKADQVMLIGSFGVSAVLIYGAVKSTLAQPRNLLGGHVLSAIIGVTAYQLCASHLWFASAAAVATAIALMHMTKTLHPPGGATALIAVIGGDKIHNLGYLYVLVPVGLGTVIMLVIALLVNNIPGSRRYPEFWF
jgi:CBS-domain-containing membrane protein